MEHYGLGRIPEEVRSIPTGEGKIGWVASHRVEMTRKDWLDQTRTEGVRPLSNHSSLCLDLISPIVRHAGDKNREGGVVTAPLPPAQPFDRRIGGRVGSDPPHGLGGVGDQAAFAHPLHGVADGIGHHGWCAPAAMSRRRCIPSKRMQSAAA